MYVDDIGKDNLPQVMNKFKMDSFDDKINQMIGSSDNTPRQVLAIENTNPMFQQSQQIINNCLPEHMDLNDKIRRLLE